MTGYSKKRMIFTYLTIIIFGRGASASLGAIPHATVHYELTAPTDAIKTQDAKVTTTNQLLDVRPTYVVRGGANLEHDAACSLLLQSARYSMSASLPSAAALSKPQTLAIALPGQDRSSEDWDYCINKYTRLGQVPENNDTMAVERDVIVPNLDPTPWGNGAPPFIVVHEFHPYPSRPKLDEKDPQVCSDGQFRLTSAIKQWLHDVSLSRDRMGGGQYDSARPTMTFEGAMCARPYIGFVDYMPGLGDEYRLYKYGRDSATTASWGQTAGVTNLAPGPGPISRTWTSGTTFTPDLGPPRYSIPTIEQQNSKTWRLQPTDTWSDPVPTSAVTVTSHHTSYITVTSASTVSPSLTFLPIAYSAIHSFISKAMASKPSAETLGWTSPPTVSHAKVTPTSVEAGSGFSSWLDGIAKAKTSKPSAESPGWSRYSPTVYSSPTVSYAKESPSLAEAFPILSALLDGIAKAKVPKSTEAASSWSAAIPMSKTTQWIWSPTPEYQATAYPRYSPTYVLPSQKPASRIWVSGFQGQTTTIDDASSPHPPSEGS